jgi:hypothetical protein
MSGLRVRDVPVGALRKLAAAPMTAWEYRDASKVQAPRGELRDGERWLASCFVNNRYSVQVSEVATEGGVIVHLWIRRHDGDMARSWADLQRIKDELVGADRVAVEVFPPRDEIVDQANMAHLWVYPDGCRLPFGLGDPR